MRNGFKDFHPVSNLIFFLSVIVFGMLFRHPVTITACFFCALLWYIMLCGRDAVKSFFTFIVPMLVFVIIIGGLTAHYGETQLLTLPGGKPLFSDLRAVGSLDPNEFHGGGDAAGIGQYADARHRHGDHVRFGCGF